MNSFNEGETLLRKIKILIRFNEYYLNDFLKCTLHVHIYYNNYIIHNKKYIINSKIN